jgi:hypothetical protein
VSNLSINRGIPHVTIVVSKSRSAIGFSLVVAAWIAAAQIIAAPVHAAGHHQGVLGYVLGASHILDMPGFTASELLGLHPKHEWTWMGFAVALGVDLVFWTGVAAILIRLRREFPTGTDNSNLAEPARSNARATSRRELLVSGGRALAGAGLAVGGWGFFAEPRWFEVTRRRVPIKGLARELDGLRIVQLSDIHHSAWMSLEWVRQIVETTNGLCADVVALTGDYVYRGVEYVRPVAAELGRLRPRIGVVGVMGNHDWWEDGALTKQAFANQGLPLIDNARRFVTRDRRLVADCRDGLCLAGVGDLWEDQCLYDAALGGIPGGMPRVLLSHNPDVAEEFAFLDSGHRVDLMLSGHTHGGQVRLPVIGAPVTNSAYGTKYASGLVEGPACPVYISRGLGMTAMPIRIGVRPEIAVLQLCAA